MRAMFGDRPNETEKLRGRTETRQGERIDPGLPILFPSGQSLDALFASFRVTEMCNRSRAR
jgi:hypothetical protein